MRKYLLITLIVIFGVYALWSLTDSVTPYVGIKEARQSAKNVQVKGLLDKTAPAPHVEGKDFVFSLLDEETGETMPVRYHGVKPDQFDEAYHIVAIGKWDGSAFSADKLLIKCPSKYEGARAAN
ncbi:MAG: cytochrome c maturation protein CcmE [Selenomonadaceae bacterium]|nr:cytochrome c maturation protein CcmE [Selenomonadaceae bacterium]